jgi:hypothetical protein
MADDIKPIDKGKNLRTSKAYPDLSDEDMDKSGARLIRNGGAVGTNR